MLAISLTASTCYEHHFSLSYNHVLIAEYFVMSIFKLIALTGLIGITVSGCVLPPDDYSRRHVVRYNQPYPVYQDRYYSHTERVYVPSPVRQRIYVNESPRHRAYSQRQWHDNDNNRSRLGNEGQQRHRNSNGEWGRQEPNRGQNKGNQPNRDNGTSHKNQEHGAERSSQSQTTHSNKAVKSYPQQNGKRVKKEFNNP